MTAEALAQGLAGSCVIPCKGEKPLTEHGSKGAADSSRTVGGGGGQDGPTQTRGMRRRRSVEPAPTTRALAERFSTPPRTWQTLAAMSVGGRVPVSAEATAAWHRRGGARLVETSPACLHRPQEMKICAQRQRWTLWGR